MHRISLGLLAVGMMVVAMPADAALIRDYQLNGTYADALGNAALTTIGDVQLGATGATFDANEGLQLGIALSTYTVETLFSFDTASTGGYKRILDFLDRTSDSGLYFLNTNLNFFGSATGPAGAFVPFAPLRVVFTRDAAGVSTGYVNGVQQFTFNDTQSRALIGSTLTFFADDNARGGETAPGFVDLIRVYDTALTAEEVALLPIQTPSPAVPEPGVWAMMIAGFGALGASLRRRRRGGRLSVA